MRKHRIILDKKTGKPKAAPPRMAVSDKIRQSKSKKVRVTRRTP